MNTYKEFEKYFLESPTWVIRKEGCPLDIFDKMDFLIAVNARRLGGVDINFAPLPP